MSTSARSASVLHGLVALKKKGLRKANTILSSAISEWKWPSSDEAENNHESDMMLFAVCDRDFGSDSSDDEIHLY